MDFITYSYNDTTLPIRRIILQQTVKVIDVLSNILVLFLIIYKVRKGRERVKDFHEPIFQQLFFIAGGIIAVRNMLWIMKLLKVDEEFRTTYSFFILFVLSVDNLLVIVTLMFTFLAALQRIVILYRPKWKHLVTGKPLTRLIVAVWIFNVVHYFINAVIFVKHYYNNITLSFRLLFFLVTVGSNLIYYHFYKLMSNFNDQHQYHRMHLLYQFAPIHTILSIFTFIQLTMEFALFMKIHEKWCLRIYMNSAGFLTPCIPTVISLSYIASRNNWRALITAVLRPVWDEITG